ncbi:MAG TPA: sigma 54-interacting transcriptional regulator [Verrucomicrobiae bacterium]|nr:sigma 54-interacting transcriptional regulator [Verrucomicrobiae bacterium]
MRARIPPAREGRPGGGSAGRVQEDRFRRKGLHSTIPMKPSTQAALLRAIQEREIRRVGENAPRRIDARPGGNEPRSGSRR